MERLIAITGGIGSGKSVVSRIVSAMGYPVYDCDTQARRLMDRSDSIKSAIAELIAPSCIINGEIDRAALSAEVFSSAEKLECLNGIVHGAVREHLAMWSSHPDRATGIRFVRQLSCIKAGLTPWSMRYGRWTPLKNCAYKE